MEKVNSSPITARQPEVPNLIIDAFFYQLSTRNYHKRELISINLESRKPGQKKFFTIRP
ncbi:MAG: hypothetical protein OP8BY_0294 [Candidatus Saccharicenans subterraneus]|uniref:Uncharacterized protein n=1 Tax=Candidatus Saccharicenans subterraneus TaxID=2508984 RepID=A0A3E2BL38_9BACT|nr:MAG: hypothetical protein OP8BY_0294 [Candidatus Saccharicenans subterraneum]